MEMNELQHNSLIQLKKMIKECHYFDLTIRINGETKIIQGDFLKDLILALPVYDAPRKREYKRREVGLDVKS